MPASPRWQDVAYALLAEVAGDCNRHPLLQIKCYLLLSIPHGKVSSFLRGR